MNAYSLTDVGRQRSENQDYLLCNLEAVGTLPNLFIVADGMGGHNAGDFASRFCVEEFTKKICESDAITVISKMDKALRETNELLIEKGKERIDYEGMGTTFVAATIEKDIMNVMNVGDSRLYLISDKIKQITEDHSLVAQMVRDGQLQKEEARFHPNKNVVTKAISTNGIVTPDFFEVEVAKDDIALLCSDGLSTMLDDNEIFSIINNNRSDLEIAARKLIEQANENGGKDNISVILIKI